MTTPSTSEQDATRPESASEFEKSIASTRALAFIRGYVRAAQELRNDERTIQLLATIEKKATEGLVASGVEIDTKVTQ